jgi:chromosome segregation ATPase
MTEVETAERTLTALQTKRDNWVRRGTDLADERSSMAFTVHTSNDAKSRARLDKLNSEIATHASELASLDSAIATAQQKLEASRREAALAEDRSQAEQLQAIVHEIVESCNEADLALSDAGAHIASLKSLLDRAHALGASHPSHDQLRVLSSAAVKTFLMTLPFPREYQHLSPSERRSFVSIGEHWRVMLMANIAERLGEPQHKEVA